MYDAMLDTACTYSLMRHSQWNQICEGEVLKPPENQKFAHANGKTYSAVGKATIIYVWHGLMWSLETYVVEDSNLTCNRSIQDLEAVFDKLHQASMTKP